MILKNKIAICVKCQDNVKASYIIDAMEFERVQTWLRSGYPCLMSTNSFQSIIIYGILEAWEIGSGKCISN